MRYFSVSKITSWVLRILFAFLVLIGVGLLLLQTLSGTSENHRKGLEQAFSDFLRANVEIGNLKEFNILPQLRFSAGEINATSNAPLLAYSIKNIKLAFGLSDLMFGTRRIEDFQIEDLKFSQGPELEVKDWRIIGGVQPEMRASGSYKEISFNLSAKIKAEASARPSYYLSDQSKIAGQFGSLNLDGIFSPAAATKQKFKDIVVFNDKKEILRGTGGFENSRLQFHLQCSTKKIDGKAAENLKILQNAELIEISGECLK